LTKWSLKQIAASLHADSDLAETRLGDFAFLEFEVGAGFGDDGDFHFWHRAISLFQLR